MLPVLFTISLPPAWAPFVFLAAALALGAWQVRSARTAGEPWPKAWQAGAVWAASGAVLLYLLVRGLAETGNNDLFHLSRPLAIPLHTYGLLIATAFLVAMSLAGRAAEREGRDSDLRARRRGRPATSPRETRWR